MNHASSGMTRIQLLILIALTALILFTSLPPWLEDRKVSQADSDVETIAGAIRKYFKHTGVYPKKLGDLMANPGLPGWKGSYLEEIPETPWGGGYRLLHNAYKVSISADHSRAPAKYRLGGVAEISRVYLEGEAGEKYWW